MPDVPFACDCGAMTGVLRDAVPHNVCHLVCYCKDCRAFARHLGQESKLEAGGGSALVQVMPAQIEITSGQEHLACLKLSPRGLLRWYASCCNTPVANTVSSSRVPLAGTWRANYATVEPFGPVTTLGFTKMALPGGPKRDKGAFGMLSGLAKRFYSGLLNGNLRQSPFFDADGAPVVEPVVLDKEARVAAYKETGSI